MYIWEGSGIDTTHIVGVGINENFGVVSGYRNSSISNVTIECIGGGAWSVAVSVPYIGGSPFGDPTFGEFVITDAKIIASGGTSTTRGINSFARELKLRNVEVIVTGHDNGANAVAIYTEPWYSGTPIMQGSLTMENVILTSASAESSGLLTDFINNIDILNLKVSVGRTALRFGSSNVRLKNVSSNAETSLTQTNTLPPPAYSNLVISESDLTGTLASSSNVSVRIANSKINGYIQSNPNLIKVNCYDGNYISIPNQ